MLGAETWNPSQTHLSNILEWRELFILRDLVGLKDVLQGVQAMIEPCKTSHPTSSLTEQVLD